MGPERNDQGKGASYATTIERFFEVTWLIASFLASSLVLEVAFGTVVYFVPKWEDAERAQNGLAKYEHSRKSSAHT